MGIERRAARCRKLTSRPAGNDSPPSPKANQPSADTRNIADEHEDSQGADLGNLSISEQGSAGYVGEGPGRQRLDVHSGDKGLVSHCIIQCCRVVGLNYPGHSG